jgi:hypothetical protein
MLTDAYKEVWKTVTIDLLYSYSRGGGGCHKLSLMKLGFTIFKHKFKLNFMEWSRKTRWDNQLA